MVHRPPFTLLPGPYKHKMIVACDSHLWEVNCPSVTVHDCQELGFIYIILYKTPGNVMRLRRQLNKLKAKKVKMFGQGHTTNKPGPGTPTKFFSTTKPFLFSRRYLALIQGCDAGAMVSLAALWFYFHLEWGKWTNNYLLIQIEWFLRETKTPRAYLSQMPHNSNHMPPKGPKVLLWKHSLAPGKTSRYLFKKLFLTLR